MIARRFPASVVQQDNFYFVSSSLVGNGAAEAKRNILGTKVVAQNADKCSQVVRSSRRTAFPADDSNPDSRPVLSKYNHRSLSLKHDSLDLNHLQEIDMKKVEALKKAVSEGTYTVPAEDLAPKLMESMFRNTLLDEAPNRASDSQLETNYQVNPQQRAVLEIPGGEMVSRKDLRSASVPSDGSPAKRGPK
jgi:flagellar biosynthesis anti-sigma factor FlgM